MNLPRLQALQQGDADAWDEAFRWLWPGAYNAAYAKLQPFLPADVEDVVMETLEELVEKVREVRRVEELKPLVAAIARNRAVSRMREHFAAKRGAGKIDSLEAGQAVSGTDYPDPAAESPLAAFEQKELTERLARTLAELKPPQGAILTDRFLNALSYEEIAQKQGIPKNSVGVYLQRGLETLRRIWGRPRDS